MKKLYRYIKINTKSKSKPKSKPKKKRVLNKNVNFRLLLQNIALSYFAYYSFISALSVSFPTSLLYDNTILYLLPVPFYMLIMAVAVEVDNKRTLDNYLLQSEIKFYKEMYKIRKKAEELYENGN